MVGTMTAMRALIVDDEPLARERLRRLAERESDIVIVGECGNGTDAIARLATGGVDILFIDMEMPGANGLEVLAKMPAADRPAVVFATAHESFALDAFEVQAVDYLLKPFDRERFQIALERAREWRETHAEGGNGEEPAGRLSFKVDGRLVLLAPSEIDWVEAADNYVVLHTASGPRHNTTSMFGSSAIPRSRSPKISSVAAGTSPTVSANGWLGASHFRVCTN